MSIILSEKLGVKARKKHLCLLCGEMINVGENYNKRTGVELGDLFSMHMHPECYFYEAQPGTVDSGFYENASDPAFDRADAMSAFSKHKSETTNQNQ